MRLRQIALVARELDPVVDDLCAVFGLQVAFNDPGVGVFGLRNAVIPVGDTFLEVVSPVQPDASAARYLARRRGDSGYMVILQSNDLAVDRQRLAALGVRLVWETSLPDIATIHLHPRDIGGAIVSLDEARPPASWRWAGPDWQRKVRTESVEEIASVEVAADEPAALARRWGQVLAADVQPAGNDRFAIRLARGDIAIAPVRDEHGEGVSAVGLRTRDRAGVTARARERGRLTADGSVHIGGVRFRCDQP
jgi:hypothetical protein